MILKKNGNVFKQTSRGVCFFYLILNISLMFNSVKYYIVCFYTILFILKLKNKEKPSYYFFYLKKIKYFDFSYLIKNL